ncbi:MAG: Fe-Mn family superoxide dismutase [Capsulimonadaceae bacterium]|nr:Fe-Mn family superoxide dismutase [Capsulimonadaceae bacterium]
MDSEVTRRQLLTQLTAAGAALAVLPAGASAARLVADTPATPSMIPMLTAKPLPEKLHWTEANGITFKTHQAHYGLYKGYVTKANEIAQALAAIGKPDPAAANQTYSPIRELKVEYSFAIGGVKNHELYFDILGGQGGVPTGDLAAAINASFGSFENYTADLTATGIASRGWAWTALDLDYGTLFNYAGDAQNTFPVWSAIPIAGLDVYEHAYYGDFSTARAKYIAAFLASLDWKAIEARYDAAVRKLKA